MFVLRGVENNRIVNYTQSRTKIDFFRFNPDNKNASLEWRYMFIVVGFVMAIGGIVYSILG